MEPCSKLDTETPKGSQTYSVTLNGDKENSSNNTPFRPVHGLPVKPSRRMNQLSGRLADLDVAMSKPANYTPRNSTPSRIVRSTPLANETPDISKHISKCATPKTVTLDFLSSKAESSNLIVGVRVRPQLLKEELDGEMKPVVSIDKNKILVETDYGQTHTFSYDFCFSSQETQDLEQEKLYKTLAKPLLTKALEGFNTCLFAYGQTGSGKSYSIMGNVGTEAQLHQHAGMVPRFCHDLFNQVKLLKNPTKGISVQVEISFFEIYKEKIQDLLCPSKSKKSLRVREHPQTGPYVEDLTHYAVNSYDEVQRWLAFGNRQRATAATSSNERSSRSHAIFTIILSQVSPLTEGNLGLMNQKKSRINFIDLAGSERVASANTVGERREEGLTINQSLLTLGRVITALSEHTFVPYRESILTWLLKESLGGDSKTAMLATISPCAGHMEETLSTLRYACQARTIINVARINEDPSARLIRNLRDRIKILEQQIKEHETRTPADSAAGANTARVQILEAEIRNLRKGLNDLQVAKTNSWQTKIHVAETKCIEAEQTLAEYGVAFSRDPKQPCLVNVNEDPLLSGTLFFPLKPGENWVGPSDCSSTSSSIQLSGGNIEERHCCFENNEGVLTLNSKAETYVNGARVAPEGVRLVHGDRIIIGNSHFFQFHYPGNAHRLSSLKVPDFESAYAELQKIQEERLKAAVLEAEEKTRIKLLGKIEEIRKEAALEMSLQRNSYEDEIAVLNRVIEKHCNMKQEDSPLPADLTFEKDGAWQEVEFMLQEAKEKLQHPTRSDLNLAALQDLIDEANVICEHFQAPFKFQVKHESSDKPVPTIRVKNILHNTVAHLTVDELYASMDILKDAATNSRSFPLHVFDGKEFSAAEDELVAPKIKEKLESLQKRLNGSLSVDDSQLSIESPKCTSLSTNADNSRGQKPRTLSLSDIVTCKDLICSIVPGEILATFSSVLSSFITTLSNPITYSSQFLLLFASQSSTLLSVFPLVTQCLLKSGEIAVEIQQDWLTASNDLAKEFQKNLVSILQNLACETTALLPSISEVRKTIDRMVTLYYEISAISSNEIHYIKGTSAGTALAAFLDANLKVHHHLINRTEFLHNSVRCPLVEGHAAKDPEGWLTKAASDVIVQVHVILEKLTDRIGNFVSSEMDLEILHSMFHQRIEVLLRTGTTLECFYESLDTQDFAKLKYSSASLEVQLSTYLNLLDATETTHSLFSDLAFTLSMMQKILTEKTRSPRVPRGIKIRRYATHLEEYLKDKDSSDLDSSAASLDHMISTPLTCFTGTPFKSSMKTTEGSKSTPKNVRFTDGLTL